MQKKILIFAFVILAVLFILECVMLDSHGKGLLYAKGFFGFLGVASGIFLMIFAKALGGFWLYRKSDYYNKEEGS